MRACPGLAVTVGVSVGECEASVAACVVHPTADVVVTGEVGMLLADATSPTRTSTRTTQDLINRQVDMVEHTTQDIQVDTEVVIVRVPTSRSPASK
jgi:hypothetical protein